PLSRPGQFPTSRSARTSDPKIAVAGHLLENPAFDIVGQMSAVSIEPARELALRPTLVSPHDGSDHATEEPAARRGLSRRHRDGTTAREIMARRGGADGAEP